MVVEAASVYAARFLARHSGGRLRAWFGNRARKRQLHTVYEEETERLFAEAGKLGYPWDSREMRDLRTLVATEANVGRFVQATLDDDLDELTREVVAEIEPALRRFHYLVLRRSFETLPAGAAETGSALVTLLARRSEQQPPPLTRELLPEPDRDNTTDMESELQLLNARRRSISVVGRDQELQGLRSWADDEQLVSVRLVTGSGGVGKTRLALELTRQLSQDKWAAGFLSHDELQRLLDQPAPWIEKWGRQTLIVIDYASAVHGQVHEFLRRLGAHPRLKRGNAVVGGLPRLRVLLLDRPGAEAWWERIAGTYANDDAWVRRIAEPNPVLLGPVVEVEDRREILQSTAKALAIPVDIPRIGEDEAFDTQLSLTRCGDPLFLMMAVLASPHDGGRAVLDSSRADLAHAIAQRERDRIARFSPEGVDGAGGKFLIHMAAISTLVRGMTNRRAREVIKCECDVAGFQPSGGPITLLHQLRRALSPSSEPKDPEPPDIGAVLPDIVGEAFVLDYLGTEVGVDQKQSLTRAANDVDVVDVLFCVIRTCQDFASNDEQRPIEWLNEMAMEPEVPLELISGVLDSVLSDVGYETVALRQVVADTAHRLVTTCRTRQQSEDSESNRAELARCLNNLGIHLGGLGAHEAALDAAAEAVDIYRVLAAARPAAFQSPLASALSNLSTRQAALGAYDAARSAARSAVESRRSLAASEQQEARLELTKALTNLGNSLGQFGEHGAALEVTIEAVDIRRSLVASQPGLFELDLANSLSNLGVHLTALGDDQGALDADHEATEITRALAAARPDAFRPALALSMSNLGVDFAAVGRYEDAIDADREAIDIYRELAAAQPDAFQPEFARVLTNLGAHLGILDRHAEALDVAREATEILRALARARPAVFNQPLARSLDLLAMIFRAQGRVEDAVRYAAEASSLASSESDDEDVERVTDTEDQER